MIWRGTDMEPAPFHEACQAQVREIHHGGVLDSSGSRPRCPHSGRIHRTRLAPPMRESLGIESAGMASSNQRRSGTKDDLQAPVQACTDLGLIEAAGDDVRLTPAGA